MHIDRLGEYSPLIEEMLKALGAKLEGDNIVIPTHSVRKTADGLEVGVLGHYCLWDQEEWLALKKVNRETIP